MTPALPPEGSSRPPFRCLSLDLEVGVRNSRIHAFAAVRSDTGQTLIFPAPGDTLATALAKLDDLADGAEFLLGHNLIAYDLPQLQAVSPDLRLLQKRTIRAALDPRRGQQRMNRRREGLPLRRGSPLPAHLFRFPGD